MSEKKHSKLSPSGSHRWIKCPGSVKLSEQFPKPAAADYAIEGTAAHQLGEYCLKRNIDAVGMEGTKIKVTENNVVQDVEVTKDMTDAVQVYLDFIRSLASQDQVDRGEKLRFVEERFDLSWLIPDTSGSNDCAVYDPSTQTMHIVDYKHGAGVVVDVEWNSQLMMYALGGMYNVWRKYIIESGKNFSMTNIVKNFYLHIVQPRTYTSDEKIKSWNVDSVTVLAWGIDVLKRAADRTKKENAQLETGEHCRFCPCLAMCPKMVEDAVAIAKTDFHNPILPEPKDLTALDVAKVMNIVDVFSSWSKEVKNYAIQLLSNGGEVPGYKLVKGRSDRKWSNEAKTIQVLSSILNDKMYTERKLISPAQAESALKTLGIKLDINNLVYKTEAGYTISKETDRRAKQIPNSAANQFAEIE